MNKKVLIIGLDGGTWRILKPIIESGYMPTLKKLMDEGSYGILKSTIPAITPAAWGAFQTGMNPGKTGIFNFAVWDEENKKFKMAHSGFLKRNLWRVLSNSGKKVGVVNVPMTYPPYKINGYMVTGIMTPSTESEFTYPSEFKKEVLSKIPDYHIFNLSNIKEGNPHKRFKGFIKKMNEAMDMRMKVASLILSKEPPDVFMVHFQVTDIVQHTYWCYLDETHPLFDARKRNYILERFYRELDERMDRVIETFRNAVKQDFITIVISDHGFQRHDKRFNLGNWLYEQGYLEINKTLYEEKTIKKILKALDILRIRKIKPVRKILKLDKKTGSGEIEPFIWERTTAFSMGRSGEGFIYVLAEGKEKEGIIQELVGKLKDVKDPENNKNVISEIYRKEEIFNGPYLHLMPDLTVVPEAEYSITGGYLPGAGYFHKVNIKEDFHIGRHHPDGIIVVHGDGIPVGKEIKANIVDVAPTILKIMGIPLPEEMDGKVINMLISE